MNNLTIQERKEKDRIYYRKYRETHSKKCKEAIHKWVIEHPEKNKEARDRWRENHREECREYARKWAKEHLDRCRINKQQWSKSHPEKCKRYRDNRRSTLRGNLDQRMSTAIGNAIRSNKTGRKWELLVGYSLEQLKSHLEKQFICGMTWENRRLWHIDHKIPIAAFNFEKPEDIDFKRCWSLKNLQPLWAKDNHSKKDKLEKPFQPSLIM